MASPATLLDLRQRLEQRFGATPFLPPVASRQIRPKEKIPWLPVGLGEGEISEWIALEEGSGERELAISALREMIGARGRWLMIDPTGEMHGPALENLGLSLSQLVFVQVRDRAETLWATEQALRSRGVDAVVCRMGRMAPVAFRRLKTAAQASGTRLLLFRGAESLNEPFLADIRLLVSPRVSPSWSHRWYRVEILKLRHGAAGGAAEVERDHETGALRMVAQLADSAGTRAISRA